MILMLEIPEQSVLIEKARRGDEQALATLAQAVKVYLEGYIGRMVLNEELTADLVQESLLVMCEQLKNLNNPHAFCSWLRKIALNRIRAHYRNGWARRTQLHANMGAEFATSSRHGTLAQVIRQEFEGLIFDAVQELPPKHRVVLCMRCYDQMSYAEMADSLECSKFSVRTTFHRAKKMLAKSLARKGLGKGALVLALTMYGKFTATSEAAASSVAICGTTLSAGLLPSVAALGVKSLVLYGVVAASLLTVSIGGLVRDPLDSWDTLAVMQPEKSSTDTVFRYCYPPQGHGAVLLQVHSSRPETGQARIFLQNDHVNSMRDSGSVTLRNAHFWYEDLAVMRLPTDSSGLTHFLDDLEGRETGLRRVSPDPQGQLIEVVQSGAEGLRQNVFPYDMSDEEFIQYGWPAHVKVVDQRDAIHQRGWTYFKLTGQLGGHQVTGSGRVPLVLAKVQDHSPYIVLTGTDGRIEDNGLEAGWFQGGQHSKLRYQGGCFFQGLNQPWMGLHVIDTVRRDAAVAGLPFTTQSVKGGRFTEVTVLGQDLTLVYTLNMLDDWIEKIAFFRGDIECGCLEFTYGVSSDEVEAFDFLSETTGRRPRDAIQTMSWLMEWVQMQIQTL